MTQQEPNPLWRDFMRLRDIFLTRESLGSAPSGGQLRRAPTSFSRQAYRGAFSMDLTARRRGTQGNFSSARLTVRDAQGRGWGKTIMGPISREELDFEFNRVEKLISRLARAGAHELPAELLKKL